MKDTAEKELLELQKASGTYAADGRIPAQYSHAELLNLQNLNPPIKRMEKVFAMKAYRGSRRGFTSRMVNRMFAKGDDRRDAGLTSPAGIRRFDNIPDGLDPATQSLDVYRPVDAEGKLPFIVSLEVCSGAHKFYPERLREAMGFLEEKTE